VWYWIFNPGTPYISCYEAYIDIGGAVTTPNDTTTDTSPDGNVTEHVTKIPVCVTGGSYDEADVLNLAVEQFTSVARKDSDIYILDQCDGTDGYQFTVEVIHTSPGADVVTIADTFCDAFDGAAEFTGSSCNISDTCGDIQTFALYDLGVTPSPVTSSASGGITVENVNGAQAYYLPIRLSGADSCGVQSVQIVVESSGSYLDSDQYTDGSTVYQFNYIQGNPNFEQLLPITLRLVLSSGQTITLTDVITDVGSGSSFGSGKTCADTDGNTLVPTAALASNVCSPSTAVTAAPTSASVTDAPTTAAPTTAAPTSKEPSTAAPISAPPTVSAAPTISRKPTDAPTSEPTSEPTHAAPTSAAPTISRAPTDAPTSEPTSEPTNAAPTTAAPNTAAPTTAAPNTAAPTTSSSMSNPTTSAPSSVLTPTNSPVMGEPTSAPSAEEPPIDQSGAARFGVHIAAIALFMFFFF